MDWLCLNVALKPCVAPAKQAITGAFSVLLTQVENVDLHNKHFDHCEQKVGAVLIGTEVRTTVRHKPNSCHGIGCEPVQWLGSKWELLTTYLG